MNQILQTSLNNNKKFSKFSGFFRLQFYISVFVIFSLVLYIIFLNFNIFKNEKNTAKLMNNYNLTRLYSNSTNGTISSVYNKLSIIGTIQIPKLNITYPIFSGYSDDLLKISPCRFYGPLPGKAGNLCIAGHNYDNDKFFSKINTLIKDDSIIIYNNSDNAFFYFVSDIYEVKNDDFSPIYDCDKDLKQLTLVSCNNFNKKRIIVKAFCK